MRKRSRSIATLDVCSCSRSPATLPASGQAPRPPLTVRAMRLEQR